MNAHPCRDPLPSLRRRLSAASGIDSTAGSLLCGSHSGSRVVSKTRWRVVSITCSCMRALNRGKTARKGRPERLVGVGAVSRGDLRGIAEPLVGFAWPGSRGGMVQGRAQAPLGEDTYHLFHHASHARDGPCCPCRRRTRVPGVASLW